MAGDAGGEAPSPLELEHIIGYAGTTPQSLQPHVVDADAMIYYVSSNVVVASTKDPHAQKLLRAHTGMVSCIAQSADGDYIASGQAAPAAERSGDAWVMVWSYREGAPVYRLAGLKGRVLAVAFSRDNRFVAASDEEARLYLWDMQNGQVAHASRLDKPATFVTWGAIFARENKRGAPRPSTYRFCVASGSQLKEFALDYNVRQMQFELEPAPMTMPSSGLQRVHNLGCYSQGDVPAFVLTCTSAGELCAFATAPEDGVPSHMASQAADSSSVQRKNGVFRACVPVSSGKGGLLSLAQDGEYVWLGAGDGKVKRFRGEDQRWEMEAEVMLDAGVVSLGLCADRRTLLAGTTAGTMFTLDAGSLRPTMLFGAHTAPVVGAAFGSATSDRVATAAEDGTVRLWDLNTYEATFQTRRVGQVATCIHVGADDGPAGTPGLVLTGWADGAVYCHDPFSKDNGQDGLVWSIAKAHAGKVTAIAFSELAILTAGEDGKLRAWTLGGRRCEFEFAEHSKAITAMLVDTEDPTRVHTCGHDQLVVTLDLKRKRRVTYHALREGQLTSMVQRREGDQELMTATHDGIIFVWDIDELGPVGMLREPQLQRLNCLSLSPSGKFLAVATDQGAHVQVWDIASGQPGSNTAPVAVGVAHSQSVTSVCWSPDEKQLISTGKDGTVAVWNWFGE